MALGDSRKWIGHRGEVSISCNHRVQTPFHCTTLRPTGQSKWVLPFFAICRDYSVATRKQSCVIVLWALLSILTFHHISRAQNTNIWVEFLNYDVQCERNNKLGLQWPHTVSCILSAFHADPSHTLLKTWTCADSSTCWPSWPVWLLPHSSRMPL